MPRRLSIIQFMQDYHKILSTPCEPVKEIDDKIRYLIADMKYTCQLAGGLGLAAPQVGKNIQIIVFNGKVFSKEEEPWICMINPEKLDILDNTIVRESEYCLSFPRLAKQVDRYKEVQLTACVEDLDHRACLIGKDLGARLIQHELDHLQGKTLANL